ncbi:MAG TPA: HAD family hydrolase [Rhodopila sp.]|uniref:HAD family hydrolase n=1 Tax=Rhodopila sp. TaxID=2480087 RepID=UPI002BE7EE9C|nr:HAD family hydrolase [Rhodopila sp.]HVY14430.1 HAD family hydrolase [Rhodopila sp.]
MPRTLLLDLDGTLVDTVPDLEAALNRLMANRGLPGFTTAEVKSMVGDGVVALVGKAFAARGGAPDAAAVGDFTADYQGHVAVGSRLYPAVPETLEALAAAGWTLAICTNKPERPARALLQTLGLMPLIAAVGGGDSFPARKPDPSHLLATLGLVHGCVERTVMLGDHHNDIVSARGAGVAGIFAAWGYGAPGMETGCAAIAHDIREAAAIAERLVPTG